MMNEMKSKIVKFDFVKDMIRVALLCRDIEGFMNIFTIKFTHNVIANAC